MRLLQMLSACALAVCVLLSPALAQKQKKTDGPFLFVFFRDPGAQGIYFALSRDGYHYTELNDGQPWIKPREEKQIFRDPFIARTPDGKSFRLVWTWDWRSNSIGTSESSDLVTWSPQRKVEIMEAHPDVLNTWAPETYWDVQKKQWLLIWSSAFKDTADGKPGEGLRLWASRTKDFHSFTKPERFFDRGFPVIDATLFQRGKNDVVMVLKDQTKEPLTYNERWTSGPTIEGPWGELSDVMNTPWSEGPSVLQLGDKAVVFYDHYREPNIRYEAIATKDWKHWEDVTSEIRLPAKSKHGSFLRITEKEAERLMQRHDGVATK